MISIIRPGASSEFSEEEPRSFMPLGGNIVRIIKIKTVPIEQVNTMVNKDSFEEEPEDYDYDEEPEDELDEIPDEDDELDELPDIDFDKLPDEDEAEDFDEDEEDFEGLDGDL